MPAGSWWWTVYVLESFLSSGYYLYIFSHQHLLPIWIQQHHFLNRWSFSKVLSRSPGVERNSISYQGACSPPQDLSLYARSCLWMPLCHICVLHCTHAVRVAEGLSTENPKTDTFNTLLFTLDFVSGNVHQRKPIHRGRGRSCSFIFERHKEDQYILKKSSWLKRPLPVSFIKLAVSLL